MTKFGSHLRIATRLRKLAKGQRGLVVAGGDAALMLELAEHALDPVAVLVALGVAGDHLTPVRLGGNDWKDAVHQQVCTHSVTVIALVGKQGLGRDSGERHEVIDCAVIRCFAYRQDEAERASLIVAAGVDLARKAAA